MATEIVIPKLGMTMTEGTLADWLVPDGAEVVADQPLFHLTTEKLDHEEVATAAGIVRHEAAAGVTLPCGTRIGWLLALGESLGSGDADAPADDLPEEWSPGDDGETRRVGAAEIEIVDRADRRRPEPPAPSDQRLLASPAARALAERMGVEIGRVQGTGPRGRVLMADVLAVQGPADAASAPTPAAVSTAGPAAPVSPVARRLADALDVDLAGVAGSGPGGRVTKEDVERAAASRAAATAPALPVQPAPSQPGATQPGATQPGATQPAATTATTATTATPGAATTTAPAPPVPAPLITDGTPADAGAVSAAPAPIPITGMRKVIAERMHASLQQTAQLTLTTEVEADNLVMLRTQLVAEFADAGVKPSYTDLVMRAAAKALCRHPALNAEVRGSDVVLHGDIHVGMAISLDPSPRTGPLGGLVVAVTRNTDRLPIRDLAAETTRLATGARAGTLSLDEISGTTFTVTALGSQGIDAFTPIINPPNVAILGVGRIKDAVRWQGDRPTRGKSLTLSLTIDHRVIDGAPGAAFLKDVGELLEQPYRLLV